MDSRFRSTRRGPAPAYLALACLLALALGACGGGRGTDPEPDPAAGTPATEPGAGTLPPPAPPQPPTWIPAAASYGRVALFGSFSSDLVRRGDTLFTVDADQLDTNGARVLAYDVSGSAPIVSTQFQATVVRPGDLRDSLGQIPDPTQPIGFGLFVNDLLVHADDLGFLLVNAGGSDTAPTLSSVVLFDPTRGTVLESYNLNDVYTAPMPVADSAGTIVPGGIFVQSGAEAMAYVPTSARTGRLYIAMSNLVFGAPSYGATKYPGTIQVLNVDLDAAPRVQPVSSPGQVTRTYQTVAYNPVALETVGVEVRPGGAPRTRLLVTLAGTTGYDALGKLVPVTSSGVEAYDAQTGALEARFDLGLAGLAATRPALGEDPAGHRIGFFPSSVTGEIYLLRLDGLFSEVIDATRLAVLRGPANGIPVTAAQAGGPGGNVTGVALAPDARTLAVCGFGDLFATPPLPGRLFLLSLPEDLVTGAGFGADFTPGATEFGAVPGRTLSHVVLVPNAGTRPDVYVNVSGTLDANFLGSGPAGLGSLQTHGLFR